MKILAFEFSSPQRSVAVLVADDTGKVQARAEVVERAPGNTMKPLEMTAAALRQVGVEREQIDCIAVGIGPGSYTGIRAGIALTQGWQLGRPVKILGVSSAECIAAKAQTEGLRGPVTVVIDAQKGEFYLADYELTETQFRAIKPLRLASREEALTCERDGSQLIGPEVSKWFPQAKEVCPNAATLAQLAVPRSDFITAEKLEPIYLRETTFVKAPPPRILPAT